MDKEQYGIVNKKKGIFFMKTQKFCWKSERNSIEYTILKYQKISSC